jgi:hypothetical protein
MAITAISQSREIDSSNTFLAVGTAIAADAKINIYVVNKTGSSGNFRLAISPTSPVAGEYLFYNVTLAASGTFVASDVYVKATDNIWVYAPLNFSARVDGVTLV